MRQILSYIIVLGKRDESLLSIIPPSSLNHPLIKNIERLPHSFEHYIYGIDYYQNVLLSGVPSRKIVHFIYAEDIESLGGFFLTSNGLNVILLCTDEKECIETANIAFSRIYDKKFVFLASKSNKANFLMPNVFTSNDDFFIYLYNYVKLNIKIDENSLPFCVPVFANIAKAKHSFLPTIVNLNMINSIIGNWGYEYTRSIEDASNESKVALKELNDYTRQNMISEQIKLFNTIENESKKNFEGDIRFKDQFNAPLVMALPYTNIDVRKLNMIKINGAEQKITKDIEGGF